MFGGLMLGMPLAALDQTVVAAALPTMAQELGGLDDLSWVITSYLLTTTMTMPFWGKLGDLFGRKRLFQAAVVAFLVGSVLSASAATMSQLIVARSIQGIGGGGLLVLAQGLIADVVSPRERGRYQAYFAGAYGVASVAGPLLGGFFTDSLSWRWAFSINVPIGLASLALTSAGAPASHRRERVDIDVLGGVLLIGCITCVVLISSWGGTRHAWGSALMIWLIVGALSCLVGFVLAERRAIEPILPLHLFRDRVFAVSSVMAVVVGIGLFAAISFIPLFVQASGSTATRSGFVLMPLMLGMVGGSIGASQVVTRTGRYKVFPVAGAALLATGVALLATLDPTTPKLHVALYMAAVGVGSTLVTHVLIVATQNAVAAEHLGIATSAVNFFRSIGGAVGVAVLGAVLQSRLGAALVSRLAPGAEGSSPADALAGVSAAERAHVVDVVASAVAAAFAYAIPVMLLAFAISWLLPELPLRTTTHPDDPAAPVPLSAIEVAAP
jgi:EmrB/QacA subfamily drug resistance transporter